LMRILPVVFTVFLLTFPAGLFVYWITSNLVTLGQNYVIYNHGPGRKSPADVASSGRTGATTSRHQQTNSGANGREASRADSSDSATRAAKSPKRKRRRKKKR